MKHVMCNLKRGMLRCPPPNLMDWTLGDSFLWIFENQENFSANLLHCTNTSWAIPFSFYWQDSFSFTLVIFFLPIGWLCFCLIPILPKSWLPNFGWHCFFLSAYADSVASNWLTLFLSIVWFSFYPLVVSLCLCPNHLYSYWLASFFLLSFFLLDASFA